MSASQRLGKDQRVLEDPKVLDWRLQELLEAGYPKKYAWLLAKNGSVDLHEAVELIGKTRTRHPDKRAARLASSILQ